MARRKSLSLYGYACLGYLAFRLPILHGALACVALALFSPGTAVAQPVGAGGIEITDVDFLHGTTATFDGLTSVSPQTHALVMFESGDPDNDQLIKLPEWTAAGNREPAALEMGKEIEIFARFHAPDLFIIRNGQRVVEHLESAEIWAESSDP